MLYVLCLSSFATSDPLSAYIYLCFPTLLSPHNYYLLPKTSTFLTFGWKSRTVLRRSTQQRPFEKVSLKVKVCLIKKSRVGIPAVHLHYAKLHFYFSEDNFKCIKLLKACTVSWTLETPQTHRECTQLLSYIFSVSKCSTWHNIIMTIVSGVNTSPVTSNETSYAHTCMQTLKTSMQAHCSDLHLLQMLLYVYTNHKAY